MLLLRLTILQSVLLLQSLSKFPDLDIDEKLWLDVDDIW